MKCINLILMKAKHKQYKERKQEHDLDLETKMPKCMEMPPFIGQNLELLI